MMAHPLSSPLDAAEMFTARGWVVFPCDHPDAGTHCTGTARACRERRCKAETDPAQRGKHPRVSWGSVLEPVDAAQRSRWWGRDTVPANIAIACGPSGLLIVDEDERNAFRAFCAHEGHELPQTFTVETGRGAHYYFTVPVDPQTGQRVPVGNSPGALAAWHCDVRGGASASGERGGYVITAGSTHASGRIYLAPEPYAETIVAPDWLIKAIMSPGPSAPAEGLAGADGGRGGTAGRASDIARWDDATRYGSAQDLLGQFERHCDEVTHTGGEFRYELFRAARDGWRLVHLGLLDEPEMQRALEACVWRVWEAEPDDNDLKIFWEEALPAAQRSPWELTGSELRARAGVTTIEPGRTFLRTSEAAALDHPDDHPGAPGVTSDDAADDLSTDGKRPVDRDHGPSQDDEIETPPAPPGVRRADWTSAYRRRTADIAVRDYLAARDEEPLPYFTPKQRKDRPRPDYLVPKMIYRRGITILFGPSGCGKSTFALDVALSFAAGQQWRGVRLANAIGERGMVHYVMAEGEDATNLRTDAWLYHHELSDDDIEGHYASIPAIVMLTEAGIKRYLPVVQQDQPDLIILDTKNLMYDGQESAGDDLGEMLRILRKLQAAANGCAIILIDHPGLKALDRVRGGNAEEAGADTVLVMTEDHGLRTVEVKKDRSAAPGVRWHCRLHQIDEIPRGAFVDAPVVCVEASPDEGPIRPRIGWPMFRLSDDLSAVIRKAEGKGKDAAADVVRLLVGLGRDEEGQTTAQIISMIGRECPRDFGRSTIKGAVATLRTAGVIESIGTASAPKYVIVEEWRAHVTEE